MAALVERPTKYVGPPSPYLTCPVCNQVFNDPVISVGCGHSFCRTCLEIKENQDGATCPLDSVPSPQIVSNRSLAGQVAELQVHCRHGIIWSPGENDYIIDPDGCPEILKAGDSHSHEGKCAYALVPCPQGGVQCGHYRRRLVTEHLQHCTSRSCANKAKGCEFTGSLEDISKHLPACVFRGTTTLCQKDNGKCCCSAVKSQAELLRSQNTRLEQLVTSLTTRIQNMEKEHAQLQTDMKNVVSLTTDLKQQVHDLHSQIEQTKPLRRTPSSGSTCRTKVTSKGPFGPPSPQRVETWVMPFQFKCIGTMRGHRAEVLHLASWGPMLCSAGADNVIKVWSLDALAKGCCKTLSAGPSKIQHLAVFGSYLYSTGDDLTLRTWDMEAGEQHASVENAHEEEIAAMVCSGEYLFTSSKSNVKVWSVPVPEPVKTLTGMHHWVRSLELNYGRDRLYIGSHNTIEVLEVQEPFSRKALIEHKHGTAMSMAITSRHIIVGTYNQNIFLFDVNTHAPLDRKLAGHIGSVNSLQVSPSGRFLFSGSSDNTVQIWDLENLLPVQLLNRHEGGINSVLLYNDMLLSASDDREIKVFHHFSLPH